MNAKQDPPPLDQESRIHLYLNMLKGESERGKIILLASKIDELLKDLLTQFFKPARLKNNSDEDKLFRIMGPLSSFSARIETAYRAGLISKTQADCYDVLREIRNDCAHKMEPYSYAHGNHSAKFDRFKDLSYTVSGMRQFLTLVEKAEKQFGPKHTEAESKETIFFMVTLLHILRLEDTIGELTMVRDSFVDLENPENWNQFIEALRKRNLKNLKPPKKART